MSIQTRTSAIQNEIVRLYCTFELNGRLSNPAAQPLVEIIDTDGVTVLDTVPAQIEHTGIWYADWYVPANLPVGNYYDRWTFQWLSTADVGEIVSTFSVYSLESYINFISPTVSQVISDRAYQLMMDLSNDFIYEAMHIPIYWEQAMRVQQENQQKRIKKYYYFTLDADKYSVTEGAVYFNNNQRFTVFESLVPFYSSSSTSSESEGNVSTSSSSTSSIDSSSSSYSSSSSSSELSSESYSESSSSIIGTTTTTTTTEWSYKAILTCVGTGAPTSSGTLAKVSGTGPDTITFVSYEEKTSRFSTIYNCAYHNWNRDPRPIARINNRIVDDGWYADYDGRLYFDGLMAPEDSVNITYNFRYFSDEEILSFLSLGLKIMNSVPPSSIIYSSITRMPAEWDAPVLLYAAITALKRLIFGLNFQEKMIIFGEPEAARNAISTFQQLYQDYNTLWLEIKKNAKTEKLYGMAQYVTPEYTLPGGRCMSRDTYINCEINNRKQRLTIEEIFFIFESGEKIIRVQSILNNEVVYVNVGKVWKSGQKQTYIIDSGSEKIRLTNEHLVYIPHDNIYKPVQDLRIGDKIMTLSNDNLVVKELISNPKEYIIEEVYDIEVPLTENFIGNNIVSHNSRWFRYLYKSGN